MKHKKIWILTGCGCLAAGLLCGGIGIAAGALSPSYYAKAWNLQDQTDTISEEFSAILVDAANANITIQGGETASVSAKNIETDGYQVKVENQTLQISQQNSLSKHSWQKWIHLDSLFPMAEITITLPEVRYNAVAVALNAGDCTVSNVAANTLSLDQDYGNSQLSGIHASSLTASCDAGNLTLSDIDANSASLSLDFGDLSVENAKIPGNFQLSASAGDVSLSQVLAGNVTSVQLDYGDLEMTDCTMQSADTEENVYLLDCGNCTISNSAFQDSSFSLDFGDFQTKETTLLGNTAITDSMGNITLELAGSPDDYQVISELAGSSGSSGKTNQIQIYGDDTLTNVSVSFTESK